MTKVVSDRFEFQLVAKCQDLQQVIENGASVDASERMNEGECAERIIAQQQEFLTGNSSFNYLLNWSDCVCRILHTHTRLLVA